MLTILEKLMMNRNIKLVFGICTAIVLGIFFTGTALALWPPSIDIDLKPKLPKFDLILPKAKNTEEFALNFLKKPKPLSPILLNDKAR